MSRFAEFSPRDASEPRAPAPARLVVRRAGAADASSIGRISASRDGGEPAVHTAAVLRELSATEAGAARGVWVTVVGGEVVGYARAVRFERAPDALAATAPSGWYLVGVVVDPAHRRRGIGEALTVARLDWLAGRTDVVRYFANARNRPTIDLHARLGFVEVTRDFLFPGVTFDGGVGVLFERRKQCAVSPSPSGSGSGSGTVP